MERLPLDEVALVRSAAEALAARGGKGRTTAKQELALAAALAILAGRWRYHPEKEHVALACKAYGAGMKQVRITSSTCNSCTDLLLLLVALGGRTRTAFSNWIASWRGALLKATRSEVSPSTSFPTHPYATLTRPAMHCAVSRDVAPDNSCWFAAIANEAGGGKTALSVRRTLVGWLGAHGRDRPTDNGMQFADAGVLQECGPGKFAESYRHWLEYMSKPDSWGGAELLQYAALAVFGWRSITVLQSLGADDPAYRQGVTAGHPPRSYRVKNGLGPPPETDTRRV